MSSSLLIPAESIGGRDINGATIKSVKKGIIFSRTSCCGAQLCLMSPGDIYLSIGAISPTTVKGRAAIDHASKIIGTNSAAYLFTKHRKGLLGGRSPLRKRVWRKTRGL